MKGKLLFCVTFQINAVFFSKVTYFYFIQFVCERERERLRQGLSVCSGKRTFQFNNGDKDRAHCCHMQDSIFVLSKIVTVCQECAALQISSLKHCVQIEFSFLQRVLQEIMRNTPLHVLLLFFYCVLNIYFKHLITVGYLPIHIMN